MLAGLCIYCSTSGASLFRVREIRTGAIIRADEAMTMNHEQQFFGRKYLRFRELHAVGLAPCRPTLMRWIRQGRFPPPLKLGPRVIVWDVAEVQEMLAALKEEAAPTTSV